MKWIFLSFSSLVLGHSNMFQPKLREGPSDHFGYCSAEIIEAGKNICKGPCHTPKNPQIFEERHDSFPKYQRGDEINVEWFRQNHPGGFVRLSIVPYEESDNPSAFDSNVILITCYETNCSEDFPHNFNDTAKIGANNHDSENNRCNIKLKVPGHLTDGSYTLQWLWHSGGFRFGNQQDPFANYYSCSDIIIQGGEVSEKPAHAFIGGDAWDSNPNQCRHWGNNDPHSCAEGANENCPSGFFKSGPHASVL